MARPLPLLLLGIVAGYGCAGLRNAPRGRVCSGGHEGVPLDAASSTACEAACAEFIRTSAVGDQLHGCCTQQATSNDAPTAEFECTVSVGASLPTNASSAAAFQSVACDLTNASADATFAPARATHSNKNKRRYIACWRLGPALLFWRCPLA